MFDAFKHAFSNAYENFELGLAGISDIIGVTHDKAAQVYTEQSAAAYSTQDERDQALAVAKRSEDAGGILRPALKKTAQDVVDEAGELADAGENFLIGTLVAVGLTVAAVGAAAFYFRSEIRQGVGVVLKHL